MLTIRSIYPKTFPTTTTRSASSDKLQRLYVVADFYFFFHNVLLLKTYSYVCNGFSNESSMCYGTLRRREESLLSFCIFIGQFIWCYDFIFSLLCPLAIASTERHSLCGRTSQLRLAFFIRNHTDKTYQSLSPRNRRA